MGNAQWQAESDGEQGFHGVGVASQVNVWSVCTQQPPRLMRGGCLFTS